MKRFFTVAIFIFCILPATYASHIVGGEFELIHLEGFRYQINLNLYFDVLNNNFGGNPPEVVDPFIDAVIFRKSDNTRLQQINLPFVIKSAVAYFQPDCSNGEVVTDKLIYSTEIELDPNLYSDPGGYYISWERCCRNYTITNIISNNPASSPNFSGQTFYLEFPPIVDTTGNPFINSSPILFPPLNDYACANRFYWVDFTGTDLDGDSLVYNLVTPLSTFNGTAYPLDGFGNRVGANSGPYPLINWQSGFNLGNIMNGIPDLEISSDGFLTVTPTLQGLYAFAVKCEEFRDGKKIGEVRRDFQLLVLDCPPPGNAPEIFGQVSGESGLYSEGQVISFSNTDDPKCLEVLVTDLDPAERITLRANPVNFSGNVNGIFSSIQNIITNPGDTVRFDVCLPDCPYIEGQPYLIDIIAFDDACALPLTDTVRLTIDVEAPQNEDPFFSNGDAPIVQAFLEGTVYTLDIQALDLDDDQMILNIIPDGFNPADFGMTFTELINVDGEVSGEFVWDTGCDVYDFTEQTQFDLLFVVDDLDECDFGEPDTLSMALRVILPDNTNPEVTTSLGIPEVSVNANETLNFDAIVNDLDLDNVTLIGFGKDFQFSDFGMTFESSSGLGNASSPFEWFVDCEKYDFEAKTEFELYFVGTDEDKCKFPNADTLSVLLKVVPPANNAPELFLNNINTDQITVAVDTKVEIEIKGVDIDNDLIFLNLKDYEELRGQLNIEFTPVSGIGEVISTLVFQPDCSILEPGLPQQEFDFTFLLNDENCIEQGRDTLNFKVIIDQFSQSFEEVEIPNVFTPNGDDFNPYFTALNLPQGNCLNPFKGVKIYNRWGREVFSDGDPDFKWYAGSFPVGVYYYHIAYSDVEFKGTVTIVN